MQEPQSWVELDSRPIPSWFQKAKFGIFIHWGLFSVPAWRQLGEGLFGGYAEWYYASVYGPYRNLEPDYHEETWGTSFKYRDFAPLFTAQHFNAELWAKLFKRAGARYVVLTSKHHDGYCLWPTDNPHKKNWNAGDVGPKRDLVGEVTTAVRHEGLRMGLYYSIPEWETHRSHRCDGGYFIPEEDAQMFGTDPAKYPDEILHSQWREINERYEPSLIFTDGGEWDFDEDYTRTRELLTWLYNEAPNREHVVVNDRIHVGMPGRHGDYYSTEYNDVSYSQDHPWEESRGIGKSYGYNRAETLTDHLTAQELIDLLVRTVGRGGNLLLNVGPRADGTIPEIQRQRLEELGAWLSVNGEAVFDTEPVQSELPDGAFLVRKGEDHYLLTTTDSPSTFTLPWPLERAKDLTTNQSLDITDDGQTLHLIANTACAVKCTLSGRNRSS